MAKFQDPPLRTHIHKKAVTGQKTAVETDPIMSEGWQRYLIASTNRHTQPNIPVITVPPVTGSAGDLRVTANFLFVCVQDKPVVIWKKVALT